MGWSQADLARLLVRAAARRGERTGIDGNRISKWERGIRPSPESQVLLADVLQVPLAALAAGWPAWLPAHSELFPFTPAGSRLPLKEAVVAHTDRRAFLLTGAAALAGTASQWATADPGHFTPRATGRRIDLEFLTWLEDRARELRAFAAACGPLVADLLQTHLATVVTLIDTGVYGTPTGRRLHICAAELSAATGPGPPRRRATPVERRPARRPPGRRPRPGRGMPCRPRLSRHLAPPPEPRPDDPRPRHFPHPLPRGPIPAPRPPRPRPGHPRRHRRLHSRLRQAEIHLERARPDTTPGWVAWMSPADLQVDASRCWLDLNRPTCATHALDEGLTLLDPARTRTRAVFQVAQVDSALRSHDLEQAVTHAHVALSTGASRCTDLVRTLFPRLATHATPRVAAFIDTAQQRLHRA